MIDAVGDDVAVIVAAAFVVIAAVAVTPRKYSAPAAAAAWSAAWDTENCDPTPCLEFLEMTAEAVTDAASVEIIAAVFSTATPKAQSPAVAYSLDSNPDRTVNAYQQTDLAEALRSAMRSSHRGSTGGCAGNDGRPRRHSHRKRRGILGVAMLCCCHCLSLVLVVTERR